jgi:hypothetical protein
MVRLVVDIDDGLNNEFRKAILDRFGTRKGALRDAIREAIKVWLEKQR